MTETEQILQEIKLKAFAAVREIAMAVEFAEQAVDAIEGGVFDPRADTEVTSSQSALTTAVLSIEDFDGKLVKLRMAGAKALEKRKEAA